MDDYLFRIEIDNDGMDRKGIDKLVESLNALLWHTYGVKISQWGTINQMLIALTEEKGYIDYCLSQMANFDTEIMGELPEE